MPVPQKGMIPIGKRGAFIKHKVTVNVTDAEGHRIAVMKGAEKKFPIQFLRCLFGDFMQIYLLSLGQTVRSVDISEVKNGGKK